MTRKITENAKPADRDPLLDALTNIIDATRSSDSPRCDRKQLADVIEWAQYAYDGTQYWERERARSTAHNLIEPIGDVRRKTKKSVRTEFLASPLAQVIYLLEHDFNRGDLIKALASSPGSAAAKQAEKRLEALILDLYQIGRATPRRKKQGPGKPPKFKGDLLALASTIIRHFESATGRKFEQSWKQLNVRNRSTGRVRSIWKPARGTATEFVALVVEKIDSKRLPELRKITSEIVAERNRSAGASFL